MDREGEKKPNERMNEEGNTEEGKMDRSKARIR